MEGLGQSGAAPVTGFGSTRTVLKQWSLIVLAAIVIALAGQALVARPFAISSESMAPTLTNGDRIMVNRLSYKLGDIERGQVIVFDTPPNLDSDAAVVVKRVIGLPGEVVQFRSGQVFLDSQLLVEPYVSDDLTRQGTRRIPGCAQPEPALNLCQVPDGHVFVLGDNRSGSEDSRMYGPVRIDTVVGRAGLQVWPLGEIEQL